MENVDPDDASGDSDQQNSDGLINGHDCPHCGIWFHVEDAKPVPGKAAIKCPNCDWVIETL
ncbi:MAG: MJ0042-type zinc finger domain-containing protein [Candidatus Omnitrophota bacterium]